MWRLWDRTDRLQPHLEAEIHRVDLAGPVLDILAWGGDPRQLELLERPPDGALEAAFELLRRLGAVAGSQLTEIGRRLHRLPLHPRLSRILTDAGGAREAALACALLAEGRGAPVPDEATASDLLTAIGNERLLSPHVLRVARELQRLAGTEPAPAGPRADAGILDERRFRRALLAGYPDRVARRRLPGSPRVLMASGHGAVVTADSGVRDGEFILALDVIGSRHGEGAEARIRMASIVDRDWLRPTDIRIEHVFDEVSQEVRAFEREYYDALVLAERPARPEEVEAAASLGEAYLRRPVSREDEQLLRRLRFVGRSVPIEALVRAAAAGKRRLPDVHLLDALPWELREVLDRDAPARLRLPSGRTVRLEYREDGGVMAEVRLEELFGVAESPRVGPRAEPVLLALLAPNGRPVQLTRDLRSFWERTYPEVRRELSGRYPKHTRRWPEKP